MPTPNETLKQYWGYEQFRPMQLDIINAALEKKDVLALLPTGGGKSICFQVPALCMEGICVVISPLIALMKDQVHNLVKRGIKAVAIYSGMSQKEIDIIFDNCIYGAYKFLYISPERLTTPLAKARLLQMNISMLAIDEAHCISQWGYDFRPAYLQIAEFRELKPELAFLALTATATASVVVDIQEKLQFRANKQVFQQSFARPNLAYVVLNEENKSAKLLDIVNKVKGTGVIYVQNRRETQAVAEFLQQHGFSAAFYHAGLSAERRAQIQDDWIADKTRLIVCTNAFGMGIDKPNVRLVVHLTLPDCLEAYFQEAGRGGRDGELAYAVLLVNGVDAERLRTSYELSFPELNSVRNIYRALGSYYQLAIGAGEGQSFDFDITDFCKKYNFSVLPTLNGLKMLCLENYLDISEQVFIPATIQVLASLEDLYKYNIKNPRLDKFFKLLFREYQGIGKYPAAIREKDIATKLGWSINELKNSLETLAQQGLIAYSGAKDSPQLTFRTERLRESDIVFNRERYEFLKNRYLERMNAAIDYTEVKKCRSQLLLAYFNEHNAPVCGKCDVCTGRHQENFTDKELNEYKNYLKNVLAGRYMSITEISSLFPSNLQPRLVKALEFLIDNGVLVGNNRQQLTWKS